MKISVVVCFTSLWTLLFEVLDGYVPENQYGGQEAYGALAAFVDFMGKMSYNRLQISTYMKGFDMAGRPRKRPRGYGELAFMEEYRHHNVNDLAMKYDVAPSTIKAWESDIRLNGYSQPELSQESGSIISLGLVGLAIIAIMNWM